MGEVGAYSFYPTKNLGALGDAGMLVTDNAALANRASQLRNYGQNQRYFHPELGMNSRLDEIQAAILSERLNWLGEFTERRRAIAEAYREGIVHPMLGQLAPPEERSAHVYHLYVVTCEQRKELQTHLHQHQIQSLIHYPLPVHLQASCVNMKRDPSRLEQCERHAATCLSLPCHPQMRDQDVQRVISAVNSFKGA
jgi:dTDP-4-amino-4,6-dideoxygalactose transaminase